MNYKKTLYRGNKGPLFLYVGILWSSTNAHAGFITVTNKNPSDNDTCSISYQMLPSSEINYSCGIGDDNKDNSRDVRCRANYSTSSDQGDLNTGEQAARLTQELWRGGCPHSVITMGMSLTQLPHQTEIAQAPLCLPRDGGALDLMDLVNSNPTDIKEACQKMANILLTTLTSTSTTISSTNLINVNLPPTGVSPERTGCYINQINTAGSPEADVICTMYMLLPAGYTISSKNPPGCAIKSAKMGVTDLVTNTSGVSLPLPSVKQPSALLGIYSNSQGAFANVRISTFTTNFNNTFCGSANLVIELLCTLPTASGTTTITQNQTITLTGSNPAGPTQIFCG